MKPRVPLLNNDTLAVLTLKLSSICLIFTDWHGYFKIIHQKNRGNPDLFSVVIKSGSGIPEI